MITHFVCSKVFSRANICCPENEFLVTQSDDQDDVDGLDDDQDDVSGHHDHHDPELQKRADCADQSVLFFLAGANFWEKHTKNCAILCIFVYFLCIFWCQFFWGKIGRC